MASDHNTSKRTHDVLVIRRRSITSHLSARSCSGSLKYPPKFFSDPPTYSLQCLVRLDWYSVSHAAICLPKRSGLDGLPESEIPVFDRPILISKFRIIIIRFLIGFPTYGLYPMQVVKFSAKHQYIPTGISCPLLISIFIT